MYVDRANQASIYDSFNSPFVSVLLGPRRVGKSTLVSQYAKQHNNYKWAFLNMDNYVQRERIEKNELRNLIQEEAAQQIGVGSKLWVSIDEAQKCPALFDQVKLLYDNYKDEAVIKFILTGSGLLSLHKLGSETLAGRATLQFLHEFNLQETLNLIHSEKILKKSFFDIIENDIVQEDDSVNSSIIESYVESVSPLRPTAEKCLSELMIWGGFPEVLLQRDEKSKENYLRNYLQTYMEKDVRAIQTVHDVNLYQKLLDIIAEQTGSIKEDKKIIEALGCSRDTLKKYRGFLLATLMYKEIYPFIHQPLKRIVKSPKGYLLNNGLISHLVGISDEKILQKTGLMGHRFENWFLNELQTWLNRDYKRSEIYYWRTFSGQEVDFVVQKKPYVFPFEVTYSKNILDKKIKNLRTFMQDEKKAKIGFYIYLGNFRYDAQAKIFFIPAWGIL